MEHQQIPRNRSGLRNTGHAEEPLYRYLYAVSFHRSSFERTFQKAFAQVEHPPEVFYIPGGQVERDIVQCNMGASILEKGTSNGTITNLDGEFSISVASKATLVVKYVGYLPQEVAVAGNQKINVQLKENAVALGEVVAIGYATVKKNDATGSVTAIKPDALNKGQVTNAQDMGEQ